VSRLAAQLQGTFELRTGRGTRAILTVVVNGPRTERGSAIDA